MTRDSILIFTGVFLPEPIVSAGLMADLAEALSQKYHVVVVHPHPSRPLGFEMPAFDTSSLPYDVVEVDSFVCAESSIVGRFRESVSFGRACVRFLEEHKHEIVFVYNAPWHLFGRKMVAEFCAKNNIPNITPVQDVYPESLLSKLPKSVLLQKSAKSLLMPYDLKTLRNAQKIHTISEGMRDYLSKSRGIAKERFVVVRNWQDERPFVEYREHQKRLSHPFTFMYLGNVGPLAGLETVIEAFSMVSEEQARLVIAGSGSAKEHLQNKAAQWPNSDIQFWDVPFGKVPETQAQADVMVLPVKKGFAKSSIPSKLPAYMFSAKPVLASVDEDSDTAQSVLKCDAGWVCAPEDAELLAARMQECLRCNEDLLSEKGQRGFEFAIHEFSRTENLQKLANACLDVIKSSEQ